MKMVLSIARKVATTVHGGRDSLRENCPASGRVCRQAVREWPPLSYLTCNVHVSHLVARVALRVTMSYGREWDQGKGWDGNEYRGHTRGREEDEYYGDGAGYGEGYGEGKRRKHDHGVRTRRAARLHRHSPQDRCFLGL